MSRIRIDPNGSVTDPRGFSACGLSCGIKKQGLDFGMLVSDRPAAAAGVFTTNRLVGAPVLVCREHLKGGKARAIIATSGNANVATGPNGMEAVRRLAVKTGRAIGCPAEQVLVACTGPIGIPYPTDVALRGVGAALGRLDSARAGGRELASAIMTTDTRPKHVSARIGKVAIGAAAKGAGMIHPNMATMFCFITTDAAVPGRRLGPMLRRAVDESFNMISVDRDTSTSDTVLLLANGAGGPVDLKLFERALTDVCRRMAVAIASDGEGATKLLRVEVIGCRARSDARKAARAVVSSNLVKSAFHLMPIAGRVLSAIGNSGARAGLESARVSWGDLLVFDKGRPIKVDPDRFKLACSGDEVVIRIGFKDGKWSATAWGCDLTEEYVRCNAEYYS